MLRRLLVSFAYAFVAWWVFLWLSAGYAESVYAARYVKDLHTSPLEVVFYVYVFASAMSLLFFILAFCRVLPGTKIGR